MAEYTSLLSDLAENITNEDLEQLKSACKEDIPEDQSNNITSSKEWFSYLEKNDKLAQGRMPIHQSPWLIYFSKEQSLSPLIFYFHWRPNHLFDDMSDVTGRLTRELDC